MTKKLIALIMSFCIMASLVGAAPVLDLDKYYLTDPQKEELTILLPVIKSSPYIYDAASGSVIDDDENIYNRGLMATVIGSTLEFQIAVSSWLEVGYLNLISTNNDVASISARLLENGSHIFTLTVKGNGEASIYITLNDWRIYAFSIHVESKDVNYKKEVQEVSYESLLAAAKKNMPNIYIVNSKEVVVNSDSFDIGENRIYYMATKAENWVKSSPLEFCFYAGSGYYFYLDVDRISWSVPENHVSWYREGKGISLTGLSSGVGTLQVSVPVCVIYIPEKYDAPIGKEAWSFTGLLGYQDFNDGIWGDFAEAESWNISTLTAAASITVNEKKTAAVVEQPKWQPPYNPFTGIDITKVNNPFADLSPNDWYYESAMYLYAAGIFNSVDFGDGRTVWYDDLSLPGVSGENTLFSAAVAPSTGTERLINRTFASSNKPWYNGGAIQNRQMTVHWMYNGHKEIGYNIVSHTNNPFVDVMRNTNAYQPILWASSKGIVEGYGNGKFGPYDSITREQFCAIIVRHAKVAGITLKTGTVKNFTDANLVSSWAKSAVEACSKAGIINGYEDGSFRPQGQITRGEMGEMIYRYLNTLPKYPD